MTWEPRNAASAKTYNPAIITSGLTTPYLQRPTNFSLSKLLSSITNQNDKLKVCRTSPRRSLERRCDALVHDFALVHNASRTYHIVTQVNARLTLITDQKFQESGDVSRIELARMNRHRRRKIQRRHNDYPIALDSFSRRAYRAIPSGRPRKIDDHRAWFHVDNCFFSHQQWSGPPRHLRRRYDYI